MRVSHAECVRVGSSVPGFYASGGSGPTYPMVLFGVPWGFPGPFMVHPGYGSMLPGCSNPEVSQSGAPKPSASCKVTATGTKRRQEDGRKGETDDDLDGEDTVHLLDEHEALEFVEFDPSVQPKDEWLAPEPMAAFLDKHFNRSLSEEEREAIKEWNGKAVLPQPPDMFMETDAYWDGEHDAEI